MYKDVLRSIDGIAFFPKFSLLVFVLFFTTVILWMFMIRKGHAEHMAALPLEDGTLHPTDSGETRHG